MSTFPGLSFPPEYREIFRQEARQKWEAYRMACHEAGIQPLPADPVLQREIKEVFVYSDFIAGTCIRYPGLLTEWIGSGKLFKSDQEDSYAVRLQKRLSSVTDDAQLKTALRRFRNREMVRIAWRDLTRRAKLPETMKDLSALAEACVDQTFQMLDQWLCRMWGEPLDRHQQRQHMVVLAMGKLGAFELNFSSDIDLILTYPESGETAGGPRSITNEEYFLRLARRFVGIFGGADAEGLLFRLDLRLRPYGENGPMVMNFDAMEEYYQHQGREWERYAAIKARVISGDPQAGKNLMQRLYPFVYRRYLDYPVFDALRDMKYMIERQEQRSQMANNIKLGPGGIREIEFFGQVFQLIRGGVEPILQERSILKVLCILADEGYIPVHVRDELRDAYYFLRMTENRLQAFADQQVHHLPSDAVNRCRLAAAMGFEGWEGFIHALNTHMRTVHHHFNQLLVVDNENHADQALQKDLAAIWHGNLETEQARAILLKAGFGQPEDILPLLDALRHDSHTIHLSRDGRERLDRLIPRILEQAGGLENSFAVLVRILELIRTIERRTCYLALLLENPSALIHLAQLAEASPWIITFLSQHPVLLDELLDPRSLYSPPGKKEMSQELQQRTGRTPADDMEGQLEELCIFKQVNTLRVAAADISGNFPLMKVSDHLTWLAELIVEQIYNLAWEQMVKKYGRPGVFLEADVKERGFAVIAYGKLGGIELGYHSDLDLVFLHGETNGETAGGPRSIDNREFYFRLGQRIVHALMAHTRAGALYEVDMRLRPSGSAGMIVSRIDAFDDYYMQDAWTWEHQALVRARSICGDKGVARHFETIRKAVLSRSRDQETLRQEVLSMRERMRGQRFRPEPEMFDIKQERGGLVDIEFLVQYLVLLHAGQYPELTRWTDNMRLIETLNTVGLLSRETATVLHEAFLAYRGAIHRLDLQEKPAIESRASFEDLSRRVRHIWQSVFEDCPANDDA
jgi:glutamate-ammonia-ligase adenylyltransferase